MDREGGAGKPVQTSTGSRTQDRDRVQAGVGTRTKDRARVQGGVGTGTRTKDSGGVGEGRTRTKDRGGVGEGRARTKDRYRVQEAVGTRTKHRERVQGGVGTRPKDRGGERWKSRTKDRSGWGVGQGWWLWWARMQPRPLASEELW